MQDSLRTYLGLAMGLTETSRKKVRKTVKDVVGRSNATAEQVKTLTSDLLAANSSNREALAKLVKFEVDRTLGMVGLATAEEVAELTGRIRALEAQLRAVEVNGPAPAATRSAAARRSPERAASATLPEAPAKRTRTAAKRSPATKAATSSTRATKAPAKTAAKRASTAKSTSAAKKTSSAAKKTTSSVAKKATATPAKKATARKSAARPTKAQS